MYSVLAVVLTYRVTILFPLCFNKASSAGRSSSSRHYDGTLSVSVSSPNLRKVLGTLTDTADIDACVIERARVSVSSPNLRIVFGIAPSGRASAEAYCFYVQNIFIKLHHCIYLYYFFYMLAIDSSY